MIKSVDFLFTTEIIMIQKLYTYSDKTIYMKKFNNIESAKTFRDAMMFV